MNEKGEVLIGTFVVVFAACLLAYGIINVAESCRFYCKLDLPKYQEIGGVSKYGFAHKSSPTGLLGPVLGGIYLTVLSKKQTGPVFAGSGLEIAKGGGNGVLAENRFIIGYR